MDFRDAWLYGSPIFPDPAEMPAPKKVIKGFTKKQVMKIAKDAADKTAVEWKFYADMLDIKKGALEDAIKAVQNGQISSDEDELHPYFRKQAYKRAAKRGFDLDKAEDRFMPNVKK